MNDYRKAEYLKFLFRKSKSDLTKYEISKSDRELINNLFVKLSRSENLLKDLYILSHIRELSRIGNYFIFILKKIEDNVINFDNFMQNINTDSTFIEKELLNYLSNPDLKNKKAYDLTEEADFYEETGINQEYTGQNAEIADNKQFAEEISESGLRTEDDENAIENAEDDEEYTIFSKNYLELIQSENINEDEVFLLPNQSAENSPNEAADTIDFADTEDENDITGKNANINNSEIPETLETDLKEKENIFQNESAFDLPENSVQVKEIKEPEIPEEGTKKEDEIKITDIESSFRIKKVIPQEEAGGKETSDIHGSEKNSDFDTEDKEGKITGEFKDKPVEEEKITEQDAAETEKVKADEETEEKKSDEAVSHEKETEETEKIKLSDEIQEELNLFEEGKEAEADSDSEFRTAGEVHEHEPEPTNAEFSDYENEIRIKNNELDKEFDIMIYLVNAKPGDEEERNSIIRSISERSSHLESISRKMSLEIISNIYQTITLSFEKISDGKYDISESTLNLFKKGLTLVLSLIKGDDYFGYKDILRSIENIRNSLLEEKRKREQYIKNMKEKEALENQISRRFPGDKQKEKLILLKHLIRDTEFKLNSLEKISGEFQIYEALRSLSSNLNNLKEIVRVSNELGIKKMGQLAEASYIFIKFLQNYRINPLQEQPKEIFGYIIYCLKSLILNRKTEDLDLFISYLNDPVKLFSKKNNKKS